MHPEPLSYLLSHTPRRARSELSIFSQDWWLELAREHPDFRELKVVRGGRVIGRLPFVISRNRIGLARGHDPYWSHLGGPTLDSTLTRFEQTNTIRSLLAQLPQWASFCFVCDPNLNYADLVRHAFISAGFTHSTQITYVRLPEGDVLNPRKSKHRGHIRRAAKYLDCVDISAADFVRFMDTNLKASGRRSYAPLNSLPQILKSALDRGCARAIAAKCAKGTGFSSPAGASLYDAAIAYIWDDSRCYYWLSTNRSASEHDDTPAPHPDATKLLIVKAMEHAQEMNLIFDVDGVVTSGSHHLYRNVLGLRTQQHRDIFLRMNSLERIYGSIRRKFLGRDSFFQMHEA